MGFAHERMLFMLLKITEACSMGCTHCINDAKPDGAHMTFETFQAALDFLIRNKAYHHIIISGGEPTEHPVFPMFMGYAIAALNEIKVPKGLTIATNGFWILDNISCAKELVAAGNEYTFIQFQASTDTRYYPKKLDVTKRIWREKGFVLCKDCVEYMYPQGRAKFNNYPSAFKASKCFNVRALAKQLPNPTVENIAKELFMIGKPCTPAIRIDGGISLGESDLCPKVASIYDKEEDIIQKIKDFKCNGCYPLNENLPLIYKRFVS